MSRNKNSMKGLSVFISRVLRHQPEAAGVMLDEHGWAKVDVELEETKTPAVLYHGTPVVLKIDTDKMVENGEKFYLSENGVWLTKKVGKEYITLAEGK